MPRLSVNINDETADVLRAGIDRGASATEQVRRAVGLYAFLSSASKRGDDIHLVAAAGARVKVALT